MGRILKKKIYRIIWVFLPPILFSITTYYYFFYSLRSDITEIRLTESTREYLNIDYDKLELRHLLPNSLGQNLKFNLCLENRNKIENLEIEGSKINLEKEIENTQSNLKIGAMEIYVSEINDLNLYTERGKNLCLPIDIHKLSISTTSSTVNTGFGITDKGAFVYPAINLSRSHLYVRLNNFYVSVMILSWFITWFGFVLLWEKIIEFLVDRKQTEFRTRHGE